MIAEAAVVHAVVSVTLLAMSVLGSRLYNYFLIIF